MKFNQEIKDQVTSLYFSGVPSVELAKLFGMNSNTVRRAVCSIIGKRHRGGQQKYFCDENVFDQLTPEAAYWIGLLMADGNIRGNHVRLSLKRSDREHVAAFAAFLQTNSPIHNYSNGQSSIDVRSPCLVHKLAALGVVERKTQIACVSESLQFNAHFWRGAIDGDGCLHIHKRGDYPMVGFCGSHTLCDQFLTFVRSIVPSRARAIDKGNYAAVVLGGPRYAALVAAMYANTTVALPRKLLIANQIMGVV